MEIYDILAWLNLGITLGCATLLYFVLRTHMWREYYRFNDYTPSPYDIDSGDKTLAFLFACVLAVLWPVSMPVYFIRRYRIMKAKRRQIQQYAEAKVYRNHGYDYIEEFDEHRRDS